MKKKTGATLGAGAVGGAVLANLPVVGSVIHIAFAAAAAPVVGAAATVALPVAGVAAVGGGLYLGYKKVFGRKKPPQA